MKTLWGRLLVLCTILVGIHQTAVSASEEKSQMLWGNFQSFQYPAPVAKEDWEAKKPILRDKLRRLLGDLPPLFIPQPTLIQSVQRVGYTLEKFSFDNGAGSTVFGYLAIPEGRKVKGPAILYHHQHGGAYDVGKEEILNKYPIESIPAESFTQAGYVVLAIDAYAFGERRTQGPAGEKDTGGQTEAALFKTLIWQGRTLWGMMVRDDMLALNYLLSRPEVDPERVGATGMSMGSTRTWWLAALDERVKAAVCVVCLTRYQDLIRLGEVNQHGIYYFVPNLLKEGIDMEAVVGLIAPRPLLTLSGELDGGSPVDGVNTINQFVGDLYKLYGVPELFKGLVYKGVAHKYTPEMWKETQAWLDTYLKQNK